MVLTIAPCLRASSATSPSETCLSWSADSLPQTKTSFRAPASSVHFWSFSPVWVTRATYSSPPLIRSALSFAYTSSRSVVRSISLRT